jgi:hypothetical protein
MAQNFLISCAIVSFSRRILLGRVTYAIRLKVEALNSFEMPGSSSKTRINCNSLKCVRII